MAIIDAAALEDPTVNHNNFTKYLKKKGVRKTK